MLLRRKLFILLQILCIAHDHGQGSPYVMGHPADPFHPEVIPFFQAPLLLLLYLRGLIEARDKLMQHAFIIYMDRLSFRKSVYALAEGIHGTEISPSHKHQQDISGKAEDQKKYLCRCGSQPEGEHPGKQQ